MLSVIIPTRNTGDMFPVLLSQVTGENTQVIISDGFSNDNTLERAATAKANLAIGTPSRGAQLSRGARMAHGDWFLFLHADCKLAPNWRALVEQHIKHHPDKAGFFALKYDSPKLGARWVELMVAMRSLTISFPKGWALPYGDQGLLISRHLYDEIGGYPDWPLFEDVKIVENIGRQRIRRLGGNITTCHNKYEQDGYLKRGWRNFRLLRRYKRGEPIEKLLRDYD